MAPSPAQPQPVPPICAAFREAREDSGMSQHQFAELLRGKIPSVTQAYVQRWENHREPDLDTIAVLESALGVPKGFLLRAAGYVEDVIDVESAVLNEKRLRKPYRDALLRSYRAYLEGA